MNLQSANIRLTVNTLSGDNVAKATPGEEIVELCGYSSNFSINQIPSATISIPMGGKIDGNALSGAVRAKDWSYYLQSRTPVCVVLEVKSEDGIDGLLSNLTRHGIIHGNKGKFCLFKGYPININNSYGAKQGTLEVSLQHWLSDLALISILNPLSSPENPTSIGMETCFKPTNTAASKNMIGLPSEPRWTAAGTAGEVIYNNKGDLFEAIKKMFTYISQTEYKLTPESAGYKSEELYKAVFNALDVITGSDLDFNPKLNTGNRIISESIASTLNSQMQSSYYSTTIWDKLVTTILPSFHMALIPMVNKAEVVPAPGIFMPDKEHPDVTPDHTVQLNVSLAKTGMLAGMSLVCPVNISVPGPCSTPAGHVTCYRYPKEHTKPGVFKVCELPKWLSDYLNKLHVFNTKLADNMQFADPAQAFTNLLKYAKKVLKQVTEHYTVYDKLCQAFVKTTYFSEVTRQNSALLIANLDLRRVPGTVMKIQLPASDISESAHEYIHGVITSVGHTISPNSVQAVYRLNHVRDSNLLSDPDLSDTEDIIFQSGWSAMDASLAEVVK